MWALQKLKMKAAAGKEGITVKMMNREVLLELRWELFNWCWRSGMVSSMWKSRWCCQCQRQEAREYAGYIKEFRDISLVSKRCEGARRKAIICGGARWL